MNCLLVSVKDFFHRTGRDKFFLDSIAVLEELYGLHPDNEEDFQKLKASGCETLQKFDNFHKMQKHIEADLKKTSERMKKMSKNLKEGLYTSQEITKNAIQVFYASWVCAQESGHHDRLHFNHIDTINYQKTLSRL